MPSAVNRRNTQRALFINSGILGHESVARLIHKAILQDPEVDAVHINLSDGLTTTDKILRRVLCFRLFGSVKCSSSNIDPARWRHE